MKKYSHYIQNQLEKVKSTAAQFISAKNENEAHIFELTSATYEKLNQHAVRQQTTVQALVCHVVEQYISALTEQAKNNISIERKERNPLLYLEGLCQQHD